MSARTECVDCESGDAEQFCSPGRRYEVPFELIEECRKFWIALVALRPRH